jgi:hypothetical protein
MEIAIGKNPFYKLLKKDFEDEFIIFPEFYDNMKLLIKQKYDNYIKQIWKYRKIIKFAVYPDYVYKLFVLPENITYIYPLHSFKQLNFVEKLKQKYKIIIGYCSNYKYRDYTLHQFLKRINEPKWYLGISSQSELREAIKYFEYGDITLILLGSYYQIRNYDYVKKQLNNLKKTVK